MKFELSRYLPSLIIADKICKSLVLFNLFKYF